MTKIGYEVMSGIDKKTHPSSGPIEGPSGIRKPKNKAVINPDYKSPHKIVILANGRFYKTLKEG
jgi:hypothetical protein